MTPPLRVVELADTEPTLILPRSEVTHTVQLGLPVSPAVVKASACREPAMVMFPLAKATMVPLIPALAEAVTVPGMFMKLPRVLRLPTKVTLPPWVTPLADRFPAVSVMEPDIKVMEPPVVVVPVEEIKLPLSTRADERRL